MPGPEIYCVADVHWHPARPDEPAPPGAFGHFLGWLATRAAGAPVELYVLGDLFDFWFERRGRTFPFYAPHIAALKRATSAGVRIALLYGNRDFTYGEALPRACGVELRGDEVRLEVGGRRVVLEHGDLLCTRDWRYQLYRRVIRSGAARALAALVPFDRAAGAIEAMQRQSRAEIARKRTDTMEIADLAVAQRRADLVVCGHVHRPARRVVGRSEVVVLGPWGADEGWYLTLGEAPELSRYILPASAPAIDE